MASYHLSVKTVKRSAGRSAMAAAAYRSGEELKCEREGRVHDYRAKQGVRETFIVAPEDAPDWASDRSSLWNAAEARETRRNSVTAREWELALPSDISAEGRREIAESFAQSLVTRYGVVADVAIHDPHREGDQRNHHAHVLTTTRVMGPDGLTDKTRILDAAKTGGVEIEEMREHWADLQNLALEREGLELRVDHRALEVQRAEALEMGDTLKADGLDRPAEIKLGPAANAMERRAMREARAEGVGYEPVTERGRQVHEVREERRLFEELRARMEYARETYLDAREMGADRISAGLAALRAAIDKQSGVGRDGEEAEPELEGAGESIEERLRAVVERGVDGVVGSVTPEPEDALDINQRLKDVLGRAEHGKADLGPEQGDGAPDQRLDDGGRVKPSDRPKIKDGLDEEIKNRPRPRGLGWGR